MNSESALGKYTNAMKRGDIDTCIAIEQRYSLFGYSPELVSVGLNALDSDIDPDFAIADYLAMTEVQDAQADEQEKV
jgi:hypothetical protein